jgi:hypothetical protein
MTSAPALSSRWVLFVAIFGAACAAPVAEEGPLVVACDTPSPVDTTTIYVLLDDPARDQSGRILVRVDSLSSQEGPLFDAEAGFLVQAFSTVGPGYGCASILPVGAVVRGPGRSLERAWIHVKTDLPLHVVVRTLAGDVVAEARSLPGDLVEPLTWEGGS